MHLSDHAISPLAYDAGWKLIQINYIQDEIIARIDPSGDNESLTEIFWNTITLLEEIDFDCIHQYQTLARQVKEKQYFVLELTGLNPISKLSPEMLSKIFDWLTPEDQFHVMQVRKQFAGVILNSPKYRRQKENYQSLDSDHPSRSNRQRLIPKHSSE